MSYNGVGRLRSPGLITLSLGALLVICFHLLRPGQIIAQGDMLFGYDQFNELTKGFSAWNHLHSLFGQSDPDTAWTTWLLIAGSLTRLFGASVSQILMTWLMMAAGWLGIYVFVRRLGMSEAAAFLASWAYALNPWSQLFLGSGGNPPLQSLAALLPWYGMWMARAALEPAFRRTAALLMGLVSFCFLSVIGANPALVALFVLAILVFIGLGLSIATDRFGFIKWNGPALMLVAIGSLWWLFPVVSSYLGSVPLTTLSPGVWSFVITRSSLLNNLRLNPVWGWAHPEYHPYAHAYDANPLTYVSGFLLIFGVAAALILVKADRVRMVRYIAIVALVMLFLSKGLHPPLAQLNVLFYKIPGMFLFREPTSKFPLIAIALLAIAFAVSIDLAAALRIFAKRWAAASGLGVAVCAIALSAWPTLTGEIVHGYTANYHNNVPGLPSEYIRLPHYWREAMDYLNNSPGDGGILVLPEDSFYQVDYSWGLYGADALPKWLLRRRVMMLAPLGYASFPQAASLQQLVERAVEQRSPLLPRMLSDMGVRYVLYRGDIRLTQSPSSYVLSHLDLSLEFGAPQVTFGRLDIYDLGEPRSSVFESADWIAGEYGNSSVADRVELRELEEHIPRIDLFSLPREITRAPKAFEARVDIPSPARSASRIIASGTSGPAFGFVRVGSTASIRASFLGPLPNSLNTRLPPSALGRGGQLVGRPLLSTTTLYTDDTGRMIIEIANPAASFVRTDIRIAVLAATKTVFSLEGQALSYADTVQPSGSLIWSRFAGVMLAPGETQFLLYARPAGFARARRPESADGLGVGVVRFGHTRLVGRAVLNYAPAVETYLSRGVHSTTLIGGFPVHVSASSMPSATVSLTALSPSLDVGADISVVSGTQRYLCYMRVSPLGPGESAEMDSALARCFDEASLPYEASHVVIERIDLEATLPPEMAPAQAALTAAALIASTSNYTGACPTTIAFLGSIQGKAGTTFQLSFNRYVNGIQQVQNVGRVTMPRGGTLAVNDSFSIGSTSTNVNFDQIWVHNISGGQPDLYSNRAAFSVTCGTDHDAVRALRITFRVPAPLVGTSTATISLSAWKASSAHAGQVKIGQRLVYVNPGDRNLFEKSVPVAGGELPVQVETDDARLSTLTIGSPPCACDSEMPAHVIKNADGFIVAQLPLKGPAFVLTNELYSWQWVGIRLNHGISLMPHLAADGWRNAWVATDDGTVVLFNITVMIQLALLIFGAITLAYALGSKK